MPVSYNTGPGQLMYCPERDFAYNYPRLVSCVIRAFNKDLWPGLLDRLGENYPGGPDALWEAVCDAKDRFCQFLDTCCQDPSENLEQILERSGFQDVPDVARIAWLAMLGQVMTGQLFQGIRDVTLQGEKHEMIITLMQRAREAAAIFNGVYDPFDSAHIALTQEERFRTLVTEMRESGMSQQNVRDMLANVFNKEQTLV